MTTNFEKAQFYGLIKYDKSSESFSGSEKLWIESPNKVPSNIY